MFAVIHEQAFRLLFPIMIAWDIFTRKTYILSQVNAEKWWLIYVYTHTYPRMLLASVSDLIFFSCQWSQSKLKIPFNKIDIYEF